MSFSPVSLLRGKREKPRGRAPPDPMESTKSWMGVSGHHKEFLAVLEPSDIQFHFRPCSPLFRMATHIRHAQKSPSCRPVSTWQGHPFPIWHPGFKENLLQRTAVNARVVDVYSALKSTLKNSVPWLEATKKWKRISTGERVSPLV